jgi:hypothetical protein
MITAQIGSDMTTFSQGFVRWSAWTVEVGTRESASLITDPLLRAWVNSLRKEFWRWRNGDTLYGPASVYHYLDQLDFQWNDPSDKTVSEVAPSVLRQNTPGKTRKLTSRAKMHGNDLIHNIRNLGKVKIFEPSDSNSGFSVLRHFCDPTSASVSLFRRELRIHAQQNTKWVAANLSFLCPTRKAISAMLGQLERELRSVFSTSSVKDDQQNKMSLAFVCPLLAHKYNLDNIYVHTIPKTKEDVRFVRLLCRTPSGAYTWTHLNWDASSLIHPSPKDIHLVHRLDNEGRFLGLGKH